MFFFFLSFPLIEKKKEREKEILAEVDFPREASGPQIHTTPNRTQRLSLENISTWKSLQTETHWGGPLPNPPHFCPPRGISFKWKPA